MTHIYQKTLENRHQGEGGGVGSENPRAEVGGGEGGEKARHPGGPGPLRGEVSFGAEEGSGAQGKGAGPAFFDRLFGPHSPLAQPEEEFERKIFCRREEVIEWGNRVQGRRGNAAALLGGLEADSAPAPLAALALRGRKARLAAGEGEGEGEGKKRVRPELSPFLQDEVEPLPFQKGQAEGDRQGGGFSGRQDSRIRPSEVFGETNVSSTAYSAPAPVATRHLSPAFIWRTRARWTASASSMRTVPSPMRDASV